LFVIAGSIFLEFNLPNAATWFYFSLLLVGALFAQWEKPFSLRNWDLATLFILVPGFLFLQEGHSLLEPELRWGLTSQDSEDLLKRGEWNVQTGYIWLMACSFYFFLRCLVDLAIVRRMVWAPNLNLPGLSAMTVALFLCLIAVAIRRVPDAASVTPVGKEPIALQKFQEGTTAIVQTQVEKQGFDRQDTRFWVARGAALVLHIAVIVALVLIGAIHFRSTTLGMASACMYVTLPYTGFHVGQVHHVFPAVFILWGILTYRFPILTGLLLGISAGSCFFPLLLFPLWFGFYRGRGAGRFAFGFIFGTLASLAVTALLLWSAGQFREYLTIALNLSDWQAWRRPRTESIWTGSHWAYRLPVFIAYMAFVALTIFWPAARNLGQVIAQTAAVVIGVQFWYADQGGVYVLWYLPFLVLMVLRPTVEDQRPPLLTHERNWFEKKLFELIAWIFNLVRFKTKTSLIRNV
jgi:hypothetical protein